MSNKKKMASVLITLVLIFSAAVVYVTNFPGSNPEEKTDGPILNDSTSDTTTSDTTTVTPGSDDPSCGEADQQDDGCDTPADDGCGEEDDGCDCPPSDDGCGDADDECETPSDDCGGDDGCDCPPVEECGCTLTIGYYMNHAGLGHGKQVDEVTPLIEKAGCTIYLGDKDGTKSVKVCTAAEAKNLLDRQGNSANGINRLYAQLLAAKLNILGGASDDAVADTIAAADAFLADHCADDWDGLSAEEQQDVNEWQSTLDSYNNGMIGPGHCDE